MNRVERYIVIRHGESWLDDGYGEDMARVGSWIEEGMDRLGH